MGKSPSTAAAAAAEYRAHIAEINSEQSEAKLAKRNPADASQLDVGDGSGTVGNGGTSEELTGLGGVSPDDVTLSKKRKLGV